MFRIDSFANILLQGETEGSFHLPKNCGEGSFPLPISSSGSHAFTSLGWHVTSYLLIQRNIEGIFKEYSKEYSKEYWRNIQRNIEGIFKGILKPEKKLEKITSAVRETRISRENGVPNKGPIKSLNKIVLWRSKGIQGAPELVPMVSRGVSPSDSCRSDQCCFSSLRTGNLDWGASK